MSKCVDVVWEGGGYGPRAHRKPFRYQAFVPDLIADWDVSTTGAASEEVSRATAELTHLVKTTTEASSAGQLASVLAAPLTRSEALGSSFIEGFTISNRQLALADRPSSRAKTTARAVLGNVRAMERALAVAASPDPLSVEHLQMVHQALLTGTTERQYAGKIRTEQNWIGGTSWGPLNAEFVPPPPDMLPMLLEDLVEFCNRADLPAVVQAAVAHAQFETLHPFADGNGRAGRCLIHIILGRRGMEGPLRPPISLGLAADKRGYIEGLAAFRSGGVNEWIGAFGHVVSTATASVGALIAAVEQLRSDLRQRAAHPRNDSTAAFVIDSIGSQQIWSAKELALHRGTSDAAARSALLQLQNAGALSLVSPKAKRDREWICDDMFDLLDDFERSFLA